MSEEQVTEFTFSSLFPSSEKLMVWLSYATIFGLVAFPIIALTIDKEVAIHFWVLTILDAGLLLAVLFVRGQMSLANREPQNEEQDDSKTQKKKKSKENDQNKVAQKAKKEQQKQNNKNFNKAVGKQQQFQRRK